MHLHFNNFEFSSPKHALCQVWLKLALCFLRRFLNFVDVFSLFRYYLSLENVGALYLNNLEFPTPKNVLCDVWLKLTVLDENTFKFRPYVFTLLLLSPLGKARGPSLKKLESSSLTLGYFVLSLIETGPWL